MFTLFAFTSIVFVQRLLSSVRKALGFVCFGINSPCLINCNTSKTISSCFLRDDSDNYKTITKTFTKGDLRSNKVGVSETFTNAVPAIEYRESRLNYSKLKQKLFRFGESRRNRV